VKKGFSKSLDESNADLGFTLSMGGLPTKRGAKVDGNCKSSVI